MIPPPSVDIKIYRGSEEYIFTAQAVLDFEPFEQLVPLPKPPLRTEIKTGRRTYDHSDKRYMEKVGHYSEMRTAWLMIQSLQATAGLEWEQVDPKDPATWLKWVNEFTAFLTESEMQSIVQGVTEANQPSEVRQRQAFDAFSQPQAEEVTNDLISQLAEPPSTASGELASDSESNRQV